MVVVARSVLSRRELMEYVILYFTLAIMFWIVFILTLIPRSIDTDIGLMAHCILCIIYALLWPCSLVWLLWRHRDDLIEYFRAVYTEVKDNLFR